jgi:hypothetical protein
MIKSKRAAIILSAAVVLSAFLIYCLLLSRPTRQSVKLDPQFGTPQEHESPSVASSHAAWDLTNAPPEKPTLPPCYSGLQPCAGATK